MLNSEASIEQEVLNFYQELLGSKAEVLAAVDVIVIRKGSKLIEEQTQELVRLVTTQEVDKAMLSIGVDSALGIDGITSLFFRKPWPIIKEDIYGMVRKIFQSCSMFRPINCTSITLIPKTLHVSSIKQFRPISCCFVLYKNVS